MKTTERGTIDRLARRSFYYVSVTNNKQQSVASSSSSYEYVDHNDRKLLLLSSVRLPNTPCEVGIFKTVELLTELHRPDLRSVRTGHCDARSPETLQQRVHMQDT
jgi:hypothetical protein